MRTRVLRPAITTVTVAAVILAALAVYLLFTGVTTTHADIGQYDATNTQTLTSTVPGAARGSTTTLFLPGSIGVSGDYNFENNITFDPASVVMTPDCNKDSDGPPVANNYRDRNNNGAVDAGETPCLASGAAAGTQNSAVALGLLNARCNAPLGVIHDLYAIPTPNNETNPRASTNIVFPRPEGSNDRYGGWQVGSEPTPTGGTAPVDAGFDTHADGGSLMFLNYPSYLLDMFDVDRAGPANPAVPEQVFGGNTQIAGTWVPLIFVLFKAGDLNTAFASDMPHPYARMTAAMGNPATAILNDPSALKSSPSTITDFCDPLTAISTLNATVGGITRATNPPAAGTAIGMNYTASLRDSDNDGYENAFDTCVFAANVDNGRATAGADQDIAGTTVGDMLDPACDPSPTGLGSQNNDQDGDVFPNAQDNCPLIVNPTQQNSELAQTSAFAGMDGGPLSDTIGDECDTGSITVSLNTKTTTYTFSSTVANGHFLAMGQPLPQCYNTAGVPPDADGDGYCGGVGGADSADSGGCTSAVPPNCTIRHNAWTGGGVFAPLMEYDTDRAGGDTTNASLDGTGTNIPCTARPSCVSVAPASPCPGGSTDVCPESGFDSDFLETYVGTNAAQACSVTTTALDEPYDSWAYDFNDDTRANLSDITAMGPSFNKFNNAAGGNVRTDINSDGTTNLSDVTAFGSVFNKQCRRVDGTFGTTQ